MVKEGVMSIAKELVKCVVYFKRHKIMLHSYNSLYYFMT